MHATGTLQVVPPLLRVAASTPPSETTVHKLMHFLLGLCVLATGVFTAIHVLLSMGVRVHLTSLFGAPTSPHHHADAVLGLPTCTRVPMDGGRVANGALTRLSLAAQARADVATPPGHGIVRPHRYFYDSDASVSGRNNSSSSGGGGCEVAVDAGVCLGGIAASSAPGLRGGSGSRDDAEQGPLRCLPSLVLPGAMKVLHVLALSSLPPLSCVVTATLFLRAERHGRAHALAELAPTPGPGPRRRCSPPSLPPSRPPSPSPLSLTSPLLGRRHP